MKMIILLIALLIAVPIFADVTYLNMAPSCDTQEQLMLFVTALINNDAEVVEELSGICGLMPEYLMEDATFDLISKNQGFVEVLVSYGEGAAIIWTFEENIVEFDYKL